MSGIAHSPLVRISITAAVAASLAFAQSAAPIPAQTLRGHVLDAETRSPIDVALVLMFTEAGDSVTQTLTNEEGYFSVTSPAPGSFRLLASALGYGETPAGIFDLGQGGTMSLEVRMVAEPLRLDSILVRLNRPVITHFLVRNGFVRRLQRGMGYFLTPYEIEKSPASETDELFRGIPGITVQPTGPYRAFLGDQIVMRGSAGVPCRPSVFVDGQKSDYDLDAARGLAAIAPLATVAAVEVYRGPAEVPIEYNVTRGGSENLCGVLVIWTKEGR